MIYKNSSETLAQPRGSWRREHHGQIRLSCTLVCSRRHSEKIWNILTVRSLYGTIVWRDARESTAQQQKTYFNCVDPKRIISWLEMKVTFSIYVGLSGMICVIFETVTNNFLWIMRTLVECLVLREGMATNMTQWILKDNGKVFSRRSPITLQVEEIHSAKEEKKRKLFGIFIKGRWGT